jgi:hypothetical protein
MNPSALKIVGMNLAAIIAVFAASAYPATDSLVASMETYFSALKDDFNQRAASSLVKSARAPQLGGYFAGIIKRNPSFASLMKVDAKGNVTCERVKGRQQLAKKRTVAQRTWFVKAAKGLKEFDCLVNDKNGRPLGYWSFPIVAEGPGGAKRFMGVFVAVVDLKACFLAIAKTGTQPFLVRLSDRDFFENSWNSNMIFVVYRLPVPGVDNLIVRYQKSNVSSVPQPPPIVRSDSLSVTSPSAAPAAAPADPKDTSGANLQAPSVSPAKKNMPFIVSLIVLIIVVSVLLIIQVADRINRNRTNRSKEINGPL